jgi:hypothetical protein
VDEMRQRLSAQSRSSSLSSNLHLIFGGFPHDPVYSY